MLRIFLIIPCLSLSPVTAAQNNETMELEDVVGLLQSALHVKQQANASMFSMSGITSGSGPLDVQSLAKLEEIVISKIRDGGGGDNTLFIKQIVVLIKKMQTGILAQKSANQKAINRAIAAFKKCTNKMWLMYKGTIAKYDLFDSLSIAHKDCRLAQADLASSEDMYIAKAKNAKAAFLAIKDRWEEEKESQSAKLCKSGKTETYAQQLKRLGKKFKKDFEKMKRIHGDKKKRKEWRDLAKATLARRITMLRSMNFKCKTIAKQMDHTKCSAVTTLKASCTRHTACWKAALEAYARLEKVVKEEERSMKIEWRALGRIKCFLRVLENKKNKKKKMTLEKCIATPINADHLSIKYKEIPKKTECAKDPECPCIKPYFKKEYDRSDVKEFDLKNLKVEKTKCTVCPGCK